MAKRGNPSLSNAQFKQLWFPCEGGCPDPHPGTEAHVDRFNGKQLYEVICPKDGMSDYWNAEGQVNPPQKKRR